jgi:hypothetical protein
MVVSTPLFFFLLFVCFLSTFLAVWQVTDKWLARRARDKDARQKAEELNKRSVEFALRQSLWEKDQRLETLEEQNQMMRDELRVLNTRNRFLTNEIRCDGKALTQVLPPSDQGPPHRLR